jgi:phosphatidylserine/phosphatidylglycerophosphate/cardiolipin synthase-like enzyme
MIRDTDAVFVGSQSLRALELDARREVGLIVSDPAVVKKMQHVFEEDWAKTEIGKKEQKEFEKEKKAAESDEIVLEITHS